LCALPNRPLGDENNLKLAKADLCLAQPVNEAEGTTFGVAGQHGQQQVGCASRLRISLSDTQLVDRL